MSSAVWGYDGEMSRALASHFDVNIAALYDAFAEAGVACTRGIVELLGVETSDDFGHVHPNSFDQVCDAIASGTRTQGIRTAHTSCDKSVAYKWCG